MAGVQHQTEILHEDLDRPTAARRKSSFEHVRATPIFEHPGIAGAGGDHLEHPARVCQRRAFGGERHGLRPRLRYERRPAAGFTVLTSEPMPGAFAQSKEPWAEGRG